MERDRKINLGEGDRDSEGVERERGRRVWGLESKMSKRRWKEKRERFGIKVEIQKIGKSRKKSMKREGKKMYMEIEEKKRRSDRCDGKKKRVRVM